MYGMIIFQIFKEALKEHNSNYKDFDAIVKDPAPDEKKESSSSESIKSTDTFPKSEGGIRTPLDM